MSFLTPVDIANRALQHCGTRRIVDFNEDSVQAEETEFAYDTIRRAELRRNVWRFAIRKAALRPIDTTTMQLVPSVWFSTTTYGFGAIVSDAANYLWQSRAQDNLNQNPGSSNSWEAYCGPLTVQPFDTTGTTGYFAGEIVYETPGDGKYSVYLSLQSNNGQDPRMASIWIPTIQYSNDQVVQRYNDWANSTTYGAGTAIMYTDNIVYASLAAGNVGNIPPDSPTFWIPIPTTLGPAYYDSAATYSIGQFITLAPLNGIYVSLVNSNINNPPGTSPTQWGAVNIGNFFASLIDFNLANDPALAPALWASGTTYGAAATVGASDGVIYSSIAGGNLGNDPTTTTGFWTNTGVLNPWTSVNPFGAAERTWLQLLSVTLIDMPIIYPLGSGPSTPQQTFARNIYRLPANYLRIAPQDPKAGSTSFLGAPSGLRYKDWNIEGNYIVTREVFPIALRFVADVTLVPDMDDMFCEGFAASIAKSVFKRLAGANAKWTDVLTAYNMAISEARTVNGIETGPTEPEEDDYITARW